MHVGHVVEEFEGRKVSPLIRRLAEQHVPPACHLDFLEFVSTGCSTAQLQTIIRYMGGKQPPIIHIDIEDRKGVTVASAELEGGIDWSGHSVFTTARLPETLRVALVGRPLSAFINHPLLPGDTNISSVFQGGEVVVIGVNAGFEENKEKKI